MSEVERPETPSQSQLPEPIQAEPELSLAEHEEQFPGGAKPATIHWPRSNGPSSSHWVVQPTPSNSRAVWRL